VKIRSVALCLALVVTPAVLAAQQGITERLAGRVPAEIETLVRELGAAAAARGLPVDPLIQKAIEGSAKRIAAERVALAVRNVAAQLDTAAAMLGSSDTVAIAAGAFALNAGLRGREVAELARSAAPGGNVAVALRVAGTLAALGVPPAQTVTLVEASLRSGRPPAELLTLPGQVQSEVARGMTPAQAASELARAAGGGPQGRRGPPPGNGPGSPGHAVHPTPPPPPAQRP
jgi:hypothetical protein